MIWEVLQLYIENLFVFYFDKVKIFLLIMYNDGDGVVLWYQGVELYIGLCCLQKLVWLFNYNGDDYNLMKMVNCIDLSICMWQFFDYYFNGGFMLKWFSEGLLVLDKGKKYNFEIIEC